MNVESSDVHKPARFRNLPAPLSLCLHSAHSQLPTLSISIPSVYILCLQVQDIDLSVILIPSHPSPHASAPRLQPNDSSLASHQHVRGTEDSSTRKARRVDTDSGHEHRSSAERQCCPCARRRRRWSAIHGPDVGSSHASRIHHVLTKMLQLPAHYPLYTRPG